MAAGTWRVSSQGDAGQLRDAIVGLGLPDPALAGTVQLWAALVHPRRRRRRHGHRISKCTTALPCAVRRPSITPREGRRTSGPTGRRTRWTTPETPASRTRCGTAPIVALVGNTPLASSQWPSRTSPTATANTLLIGEEYTDLLAAELNAYDRTDDQGWTDVIDNDPQRRLPAAGLRQC